ncbi:MAG: sigma-70 family RNA polymerase sigma factor [Verrucomicrobiota bacterium]
MQSDNPQDGFSEEEEAIQRGKEDIEWMLQVGQGDVEAFERLVKRHQDSVVATVVRMLGDSDEAQDIAQQVFVRVWKSAGRYQPTAKFTTWLFTITKNLVYNETRRRSRRPQVSLEEQQEKRVFPIEPVAVERPDDEALHAEMTRAIDEAIETLPENQRIALVLRRFELLSYEEIAKIMELTVPSVKSLLFRARSHLRQALESYLKK